MTRKKGTDEKKGRRRRQPSEQMNPNPGNTRAARMQTGLLEGFLVSAGGSAEKSIMLDAAPMPTPADEGEGGARGRGDRGGDRGASPTTCSPGDSWRGGGGVDAEMGSMTMCGRHVPGSGGGAVGGGWSRGGDDGGGGVTGGGGGAHVRDPVGTSVGGGGSSCAYGNADGNRARCCDTTGNGWSEAVTGTGASATGGRAAGSGPEGDWLVEGCCTAAGGVSRRAWTAAAACAGEQCALSGLAPPAPSMAKGCPAAAVTAASSSLAKVISSRRTR